MTTELKRFSEAYATMTVATYEPLIIHWYSGRTLALAAETMAWRLQKSKHLRLDKAFSTAHGLALGRARTRLKADAIRQRGGNGRAIDSSPLDLAGHSIEGREVQPVRVEGYPEAVAIEGTVYPQGVALIPRAERLSTLVDGDGERERYHLGVQTLPTFVSGAVGLVDEDFDFEKARSTLLTKLVGVAETVAANRSKSFEKELFLALGSISGKAIYEFLPRGELQEALSPIGVAHFYRQLYFNTEEGVGPIEEAFTIAPLETLEVVYETVRRQIHEEQIEVGLESISETAVETKNLEEVSDKVSSMIQRDSSAAMSANASGSIGVWQVGATASASMSASSQRGREETSRRLKEVTTRASERITKSFTIKTRDIEDVTTTNLTRRVIKNDNAAPVSYGLRRVLRRVNVKVQDLGPRLVWQLYVRNPGAGLALSRFVHFREAAPVAPPEIPPGVRPRPKGGTDTGSTSTTILWDQSRRLFYVPIVVQTGADRTVTAVSIDSISDLEGGGKDDQSPSAANQLQWGKNWDPATHQFTVRIAVAPGDSANVSVNYTYTWEPSQAILDEWETERKAAVAKLTEELLNAQFERQKTLITERSKIRPRPANDLRKEERYEVMNRMVSHLFARGDDPSDPTPLEIEYFHRFFEIDGMFTYLHPSWWKPRYSPVTTGLGRTAYEITAESEPAPLGSSLGWLIQLDGDSRRNEFLNSPWVRVCLPIRPQREREAIAWLAQHIEGQFGYDTGKDPLKSLLADIDKIRSNQDKLGGDGPDWVTVDATVGAPGGPLKPENVYPIVDEFDVTLPTDGFVYDELKVTV
jgi:hypothetical protein